MGDCFSPEEIGYDNAMEHRAKAAERDSKLLEKKISREQLRAVAGRLQAGQEISLNTLLELVNTERGPRKTTI